MGMDDPVFAGESGQIEIKPARIGSRELDTGVEAAGPRSMHQEAHIETRLRLRRDDLAQRSGYSHEIPGIGRNCVNDAQAATQVVCLHLPDRGIGADVKSKRVAQ